MRRRLLIPLLLFACAAAACSDDGTSTEPDALDTNDGDTSTDGDTDGTNDIDDGTTDGDGVTDGDGTTDGDGSGPVRENREVGEPCISRIQCESNLCVTFEAGVEGFCSQICEQTQDCPTGSEGGTYECLQLPQSSNEDVRGCIDTSFCYDPDDDGYGSGPGCPNRGFDCDQTDPTINPGAAETCDNVDRNCNGLLIDSVVFAEPTCEVAGEVGACAMGEPRCEPVFADDGETVIDGTTVCSQVVFPGDLDEICNGIDDNCNGIRDDYVDEDGNYEVPGLGVSCATQVDSCPDGITVCDESAGNVVCVATGDNPGGGDETLVCDGIDNNCNGVVDEPFKDENGIYFMKEHCGSCDVNCDNFWDGRPNDFNVVPYCDVRENFAICNYDCADGYVNADGLDDNGCELNPDEGAIYVTRPARGGVDDNACGAYTAPCATIGYAIAKANGDSTKSRVRVAEGSYAESFTMVEGISVLGGHNATNFTRNVDANVTTLTGSTVEAKRLYVVRAANITSPTELSGFTIRAPAAREARSSIGLLVENSTSALTVRDNHIFAGDGGNGTRGLSGQNGSNGNNGRSGSDSRNNLTECAENPVPGGQGAAGSCPNLRTSGTVDVSGGRGADGYQCPEFGMAQPGGQSGKGVTNPDNGGRSAHHWTAYYPVTGSRRCLQPVKSDDIQDGSTLVRSPERGGRGPAGDDGASGAGASNATGTVSGGGWSGQTGAAGQPGLPGAGGGGGGAAGGMDVENSTIVYLGASGGGGGSGGCAGEGGLGGSAGGGSFAVVLIATGSDQPTFANNSFARGRGGDGGNGGSAGSGGDGGVGGAPGQGRTENDFGFCMAPGDFGGVGGRGGHGGGGGGGAGGASFDVLVIAANPDAVTNASGLVSDNTFPLDSGTPTGGAGGSGGSSQSNPGQDGVTGASGRLLKLQP